MIKDITLGQYFPGNSIVHRLDPRYKIIISGIFIAMLLYRLKNGNKAIEIRRGGNESEMCKAQS